MKAMEALLKWFPSGTAEGERSIIEQVFIYTKEISEIISTPNGNPKLLVGPKGSGKSAIFDFSKRTLMANKTPCIMLTPIDFDTTKIGQNFSTGDMQREFLRSLIFAIANRSAEEATGWLDADRASLYFAAIDEGRRSPDTLGRIIGFFSEIAKPLLKVDLNQAFPHLTKTTLGELEQAVSSAYSQSHFFILIDDTDQVADPSKKDHLNRIWALILAVRKLSERVPCLKIVVSLRSEIWERLKNDQSIQRDQTDHFQSLIVLMRQDKNHLKQIVSRRLALASIDANGSNLGYSTFFEGETARAPYSEDWRSWEDLITVRTRNRPRDAILMFNSLARKTLEKDTKIISEDIFRAVMPTFSHQIAEQFSQEVAEECPDAAAILKSFAEIEYTYGSFTMNSDEALKHCKMLMSKFSVRLYGHVLNQTDESDAFSIWRFLFRCGVLNARLSDAREKDGYRHALPVDDAFLVSKARWNDLQAILWEVNTVYRDYLISVQNDTRYKTGLARKRPRRTR